MLKVNYQHHLKQETFPAHELQKALDADLKLLKSSHYYAVYNQRKKLVGVIRALEWNHKDELPIESDFNLNLSHIVSEISPIPENIWHIGRFAIDNEALRSDILLKSKRITILKLLLVHAFRHLSEQSNSIAIAECDSKLFDKLKLFNIHSHILGEPKTYLGSLTIPIFNTASGVKEFVDNNKDLYYV